MDLKICVAAKVKVPEDSIVEGLETLTPSQCTMFNICYGGELLAMVRVGQCFGHRLLTKRLSG